MLFMGVIYESTSTLNSIDGSLVQGWIIERTKMIDRCELRYYTLNYCPVRQRLHFIVNNIPFEFRSYMESEVIGHQ